MQQKIEILEQKAFEKWYFERRKTWRKLGVELTDADANSMWDAWKARSEITQSSPSQNGWIDCKERLPIEKSYDDKEVMIFTSTDRVYPFMLVFAETLVAMKNKGEWPEVTHWQPLPQPPIKGE